jgi:hypothetical protein
MNPEKNVPACFCYQNPYRTNFFYDIRHSGAVVGVIAISMRLSLLNTEWKQTREYGIILPYADFI